MKLRAYIRVSNVYKAFLIGIMDEKHDGDEWDLLELRDKQKEEISALLAMWFRCNHRYLELELDTEAKTLIAIPNQKDPSDK